MSDKPIKTGIKCVKCGWDDSRMFEIGSVLIRVFVCPKCSLKWEELKKEVIK